MKVIDLLNKIANDEEVPEKIKIYDDVFTYYKQDKEYAHSHDNQTLFTRYNGYILNDEIEVIEEPKNIEKLPLPLNLLNNQSFASKCLYDCIEKVNEIIDYINKENK